ncbi:hypothetical protein [Actinomadura sp. 9N407]|uniref:hypothetical protein n=1 Tax=Actinomadura sp. 9N407 TaxID=3375154 RepID=UPI00379D56AF
MTARIRKAVRARGHFPNEQAALECIYLALMRLDPTGKGQKQHCGRSSTQAGPLQGVDRTAGGETLNG